MPLLVYKCPCGKTFEELTKFSETYICSCGQTAKLIPAPMNWKLKGTGFYQNDYSINEKEKK